MNENHRRFYNILLTLLLVTTFRLAASEKRNLVPNGDFEKAGEKGPAFWTPPDNLTIFWEKNGASGKSLKLDTDVYRSEWEKHKQNPDQPIKKTQTTGTKYNTVGGTTGVAVYSYGIPIESDAYYLVEYDMKGPSGEQFVYLKAYWECQEKDVTRLGSMYFFKPDPQGPSYELMVKGTVGEEMREPHPGDYIMCFRRRFVAKMPSGGENKWHRYRGVVKIPKSSNAERVLLEVYAFWPAGQYRFDNVRMYRISAKEGKKFKEWRKKHPHGIPVD